MPLPISIGDLTKSIGDVAMCVGGHVKDLSFARGSVFCIDKSKKMVRFHPRGQVIDFKMVIGKILQNETIYGISMSHHIFGRFKCNGAKS